MHPACEREDRCGATPGADFPCIILRTLAKRAIIERAAGAKVAVVVGASFIGLEVAASLIARNLEVHVVAPEAVPMERVLGTELGKFVHALHEEHGVKFHLGQTVELIETGSVTLKDGSKIAADLVVMGVGVRPSLALAETPASRSKKASSSTNSWRRAHRASGQQGTSRAGQTPIPANR